MAEYNLGRVAFVDKGAYSLEETYNKWDFVTTVDSTYLFIGITPQIGKPVTDTSFWRCIADGKPATLAAAAATLAKEAANSAATLANEKAALAQSNATLANTKAGLANDAAVLATDKAALADSKATLANDKAILAQSAADNANAKAAEVTAAVLSAGSLGSIKPTDAAPTPARNGNYTFSIGGNKPAWLTAEAGITTVKAGDGVAVVYTEPSGYSYTHVDVSSDFVTIQRLTNLGYIYKGVATPSTTPGTPDGVLFYLASNYGTYSNFGGISLNFGEVAILIYNGGWSKQLLDVSSNEITNNRINLKPTWTNNFYYKYVDSTVTIFSDSQNRFSISDLRVSEGMYYEIKIWIYNYAATMLLIVDESNNLISNITGTTNGLVTIKGYIPANGHKLLLSNNYPNLANNDVLIYLNGSKQIFQNKKDIATNTANIATINQGNVNGYKALSPTWELGYYNINNSPTGVIGDPIYHNTTTSGAYYGTVIAVTSGEKYKFKVGTAHTHTSANGVLCLTADSSNNTVRNLTVSGINEQEITIQTGEVYLYLSNEVSVVAMADVYLKQYSLYIIPDIEQRVTDIESSILSTKDYQITGDIVTDANSFTLTTSTNDDLNLAVFTPIKNAWSVKCNYETVSGNNNAGVIFKNLRTKELIQVKMSGSNILCREYYKKTWNLVSTLTPSSINTTGILAVQKSGNKYIVFLDNVLVGSFDSNLFGYNSKLSAGISIENVTNNSKISEIKVIERKKSYAFFSIDDVVSEFQDIDTNSYASIFDNSFFALLKSWNEEYGIKVICNCFYKYNSADTWSLSDMPDTWKDEFTANSSWLKFTFHGYSYESAFPNGVSDWELVLGEIERFAGIACVSGFARTHGFGGSNAIFAAIKSGNYDLNGLSTADDSRAATGLTTNEAAILETCDDYYNYARDIYYVQSENRIDGSTSASFISTYLKPLLKSKNEQNIINLFGHNIYIVPNATAYGEIFAYLNSLNIRWDFIDNN